MSILYEKGISDDTRKPDKDYLGSVAGSAVDGDTYTPHGNYSTEERRQWAREAASVVLGEEIQEIVEQQEGEK